jgi:ABC-type branched-subunit amino acid transport system substrate-binding protein
VQAAGPSCHALAVWTGYNPPIDRYASLPDVARYADDVKTVAPGIDVRNQFLEGAYLGMSLLVEALKQAGPTLTRVRLKEVLDSMNYANTITAGLSWRPGKHQANTKARSFSIVVSQGQFNGWRDEGTDWVADPAFGG